MTSFGCANKSWNGRGRTFDATKLTWSALLPLRRRLLRCGGSRFLFCRGGLRGGLRGSHTGEGNPPLFVILPGESVRAPVESN